MKFQTQRAQEDYRDLSDVNGLPWYQNIKHINVGSSRSYLSLGGSFRPRLEYFDNRFWTENDQSYYTQRLSFHADLQLGERVRFFGELYHGYRSDEALPPNSDELDWHQGFVEITPLADGQNTLALRFGRQEANLGAGRLVDLRDGPSMRRSFDSGSLNFSRGSFNLIAWFGKEVSLTTGAFDNSFDLFDDESASPKVWGLFSRFKVWDSQNINDGNELYYIGFQSDFSAFNDVMGNETRHSIGLRRFGTLFKRWNYNTEIIYQFGDIDGSSIRAFSFETDWKFTFRGQKFSPTPGLKLDWASGDNRAGDGKVESFNPLFVNPAIYSLAAVNTPVNLIGIHPSLTLFLAKGLLLNLEFAMFYRDSKEDGLYSPPRFQTRPAAGNASRHIGNVAGLYLSYSFNSYLSFNLRSSYFTAGSFIKSSGSAEPAFHIAPTLSLLF